MKAAVNDVLELRALDPGGLNRVISWSIAVHLVALLAIAVVPRLWPGERKPAVHVMEISLGSAGPKESGVTNIGGRPVDKVEPPPKRPEPVKPVAVKPDTMVVPVKTAPPKKTPPPPKEQLKPTAPVTQPPSTGRQVTEGNSRAETGVRGIGTGLQTGGGGAGISAPGLTDFCCPGYLEDVRRRIQNHNWDEKQQERGMVTVQFTIERSGQVKDLEIIQRATYLLERASRVPFTNLQLPPLPAEYKDPTLTLRLTFEYK